ncbi:MAG: hypothetical protein KKE83_03395 [Proteobacteria bacterium]|nr:hypothetical protein [Pseudomonadota bacterium]
MNAKLGPLNACSANFYLTANLTSVPKMGLKVKSGVLGDLDLAASGNGLKLNVPADCPLRFIGFTANITDLSLTDFPITPEFNDCYGKEIMGVINGTVAIASDVCETVANEAAETAKNLGEEAQKTYLALHVALEGNSVEIPSKGRAEVGILVHVAANYNQSDFFDETHRVTFSLQKKEKKWLLHKATLRDALVRRYMPVCRSRISILVTNHLVSAPPLPRGWSSSLSYYPAITDNLKMIYLFFLCITEKTCQEFSLGIQRNTIIAFDRVIGGLDDGRMGGALCQNIQVQTKKNTPSREEMTCFLIHLQDEGFIKIIQVKEAAHGSQ